MLFICVIIPILIGLILFVIVGENIAWPYYVALTLGVPLVICISAIVIKSVSSKSTEYLGAYVLDVRHYEAWNEEVQRTREVPCGEDEDGNTISCTETYWETVDHPDEYRYSTNIGKNGHLSYSEFKEWTARLNVTPTFVDMHRNYYTKDGDLYCYDWDGSDNTMIPLAYKHSYHNPVKGSISLYNSSKVTKDTAEKYGLFDYPDIEGEHQQACVLGDVINSAWNRRVQVLNARLGKTYQFRMYILLFDGNRTTMEETFYMQKAYWNGGNKNEFVVCIGENPSDHRIMWHNSFSWQDKPLLEAETRQWLANRDRFNCIEFCDWIENVIPGSWKRKEFADFNYLSSETPIGGKIVLLILTLLFTAGLTWFILSQNEMYFR